MALTLGGCDSSISASGSPALGEEVTTSTGLRYIELAIGTGPYPKIGQVAVVHYILRLEDGTLRDNSYDRGMPFTFPLGRGRVIPGFEEGIMGMRVGGMRKLIVPPHLAYGESGAGNGLIPPDATLLFDVELIGIE